MKDSSLQDEMTPSQRIDRYIAELSDWRGEMLARMRKLVLEAAPDLTEEWKWDTPVWSKKGIVVAVGAFKDHIKLNFFKGASLDDPQGLFNAGLEAKATRAIDFNEGDEIDEAALKELIRAAVAYNISSGKKKYRRTDMAKVILGTTMSVDGFINDRNGSVVALYPDLETWRYTEPGRESIQNTGAVVMGRNSFAMAEDPDSLADNYEYQVPIFVLTHQHPEKHPKENDNLTFTFVTMDGVMQAPGGTEEDSSGGFKHGGWTVPYFDEFLGKVMDTQMDRPFDLLLGRKTYEIFASYFPIGRTTKTRVPESTRQPNMSSHTGPCNLPGINRFCCKAM